MATDTFLPSCSTRLFTLYYKHSSNNGLLWLPVSHFSLLSLLSLLMCPTQYLLRGRSREKRKIERASGNISSSFSLSVCLAVSFPFLLVFLSYPLPAYTSSLTPTFCLDNLIFQNIKKPRGYYWREDGKEAK